jgi:hypothetical protein
MEAKIGLEKALKKALTGKEGRGIINNVSGTPQQFSPLKYGINGWGY